MATKVLISIPRRLDIMSMTLHITMNEKMRTKTVWDVGSNVTGKFILSPTLIPWLNEEGKKGLNKDPRGVGGQIKIRTKHRRFEQSQASGHPNRIPQCIAYYVMSGIKSVNRS